MKLIQILRTMILIWLVLVFCLVALRAMAWADKGMYEQGNDEPFINIESIWQP